MTFYGFVFCFSCRILHALQQVQIANVFVDSWRALGAGAEDGDWAGKVYEDLALYQAFTDQKYTNNRKISTVNWHPTIYGEVLSHSLEKTIALTNTDIRWL